MSEKEKLKEKIQERAWMIGDAKIFVWGKTEGRKKELEKQKIGGGNFLVTLGLFSVLNFLSKTYYLLGDRAKLWTEQEVTAIKKALKKCPDTAGAKPPFVGSPKKTERDCFIDFAEAMDYPLFPGESSLSEPERRKMYGEIWDKFRNKLAHMAMPDATAASVDFGAYSYEDVVNMLDGNTDPAFQKIGKNYAVVTDLFSRDISKWVGWLQGEIDSGSFSDERIIKTLEWIEGKK